MYKDGRVHNLFTANEITELATASGRAPMLRIYMTELPEEKSIRDFAGSIAILAKTSGFIGVTLSSLNSLSKDKKQLEAFVFAVRKQLMGGRSAQRV